MFSPIKFLKAEIKVPTFRRTACLHTTSARCQIQSGPILREKGRGIEIDSVLTGKDKSPAIKIKGKGTINFLDIQVALENILFPLGGLFYLRKP